MSAPAPAGPLRLGVLLSGRGSNMLAIAENIRSGQLQGVEIAVAISNLADAPGLAAAGEYGLPTAVLVSKGRPRADHDADLIACLGEHKVDLVLLAGYMRLLSPGFLAAFPNRILNIHPSLLPAFPGLDTHARALAAGVRFAGCTVHFVRAEMDHGPIVVQAAVPVLPGDDAATLAARVLAAEHRAYPLALRLMGEGRVKIVGERVAIAGAAGRIATLLNPSDESQA